MKLWRRIKKVSVSQASQWLKPCTCCTGSKCTGRGLLLQQLCFPVCPGSSYQRHDLNLPFCPYPVQPIFHQTDLKGPYQIQFGQICFLARIQRIDTGFIFTVFTLWKGDIVFMSSSSFLKLLDPIRIMHAKLEKESHNTSVFVRL